MSNTLSALRPELIQQQLATHHSQLKLQFLSEACSSNSLLLKQAQDLAAHGTVLLVAEQNAGRGREGRSWLASAEHSLTFSLLWQFKCQAHQLSGLSLAIGVSLAHTLNQLSFPVSLKWPNDLVCKEGKLGGILLEMQRHQNHCGVVIGIGLNCHIETKLKQQLNQAAAGLDQLSSQAIDRNNLLAKLLLGLEKSLSQFASKGFAEFQEQWQQYHFYQNKTVQLRQADHTLTTGIALGVDHLGQLRLQNANGEHTFHSGELQR